MKQAVTYFLVAASGGGGSSYVTGERTRESCQKILCSSRVARSRLERCAMRLTAKRVPRAEEILTMKARTEEEEEKRKIQKEENCHMKRG